MADENTAVLDPVVDTGATDSGVVDTSQQSDGLTADVVQQTQTTDGQTQDQAPVVNEPLEDEFPSQPDEPLTVKSLTEKITKNPAFAALVNADPALKNLLYSTARQATRVGEYKSIFANAETAKTSLDLAQKQMAFDTALNQGGEATLQHLYDTHREQYFEIVGSYRTILYDSVRNSNHPKAAEAIAVIAEIMGDRVPQSGTVSQPGVQSPAQNELPPEIQEQLAEAQRYKAEKAEYQRQEVQRFNQSFVTETDRVVEADIAKVINTIKGANVALTPYAEGMIKKAVLQEINELAANDPAYKQHIQIVYNTATRDDAGKAKLVAAARAYAKEHLMNVTRKHLSEFSKPVMQQQTEKGKKIEGQLNTPNVQSASGASTPSRSGLTEQIAEFVKTHKRQPTNRELLDFE